MRLQCVLCGKNLQMAGHFYCHGYPSQRWRVHELTSACLWLCRANGAPDKQQLLPLLPSGEAAGAPMSAQAVKLAIAFNPRLRQHLLDGLGLCFVACLPSNQHTQAGETSRPLPGGDANPSAGVTRAIGHVPSNTGPAQPAEDAGLRAAALAATESSAQQILGDLQDMLRTGLQNVQHYTVS